MSDEAIPTPSVRRVDPARDAAIREYERMFEEHDTRYAQLVRYADAPMVEFLLDWHAQARAILASAICSERGVK